MTDIFEEVRSQFGVTQILTELTGQEVEPGRFGTCPVCGSGRLQITRDGKGWTCWAGHCHEGHGRDALGMAAATWKIDRTDAAKRILGDCRAETGRPALHAKRVDGIDVENPERDRRRIRADCEPWKSSAWQSWITDIVKKSQAALADPDDETSRLARVYLCKERGLSADTVKAAGIGLNRHWIISHDVVPGEKMSVAPGLLIPWRKPGGYAGAIVREYHVDLVDKKGKRTKYRMVAGSKRRRLYPGPNLESYAGPLLVTEGELDALAAQESLAGLCAVVTVGSATSGPDGLDGAEKVALAGFTRILIAADDDDSGHACREMWRDYSRRAVPLTLPPGFKDLNEAHAAGFDLRGWYMAELARLGIDPGFEPGVDVPERGLE